MYFPIFRGRQFELIALRECVNNNLLSDEVIPIVEPVKASSTLVTTLQSFLDADRSLALILNPCVGNYIKELSQERNKRVKEAVTILQDDEHIIKSLYINKKLKDNLIILKEKKITVGQTILICNNADEIATYEDTIGDEKPCFNLIPDKSEFRRRIRDNRVLCEDHFPRQPRNIDYYDIHNEFFSSDHKYYPEDGYKGFADYSVIGSEYSETGFAPYAVAIHIVYFDERLNLRIAHFVSESNDDISDPARKFAEAAEKLVEWNLTMQLNTIGVKSIEEAYHNKTFPGLGVIKKHSIMHHLELMSRYLDGEIK